MSKYKINQADLPGFTEFMKENKFVDQLIEEGVYTKEMHPFYGKKHMEESKRLMSVAASKRVGILNGFYNKTHSNDQKQKWSKLRSKEGDNMSATYGFKGKKHSDGAKEKISQSLKNNTNRNRRAVIQMDMNNNVIATYDSLSEAGDAVGTSASNIKYTIEGKFKHAKCYKWRYAI